MNLPPSAAAPAPPSSAPRRDWPRRLVNFGITLVVVAVAAATFVLSYAGVHAIALQGGVSVQLARIYPGLFDAVLVIACVAAVVLRDGRWWARCWAWLVAIVVLGAIGVTDVLHAMDYALRHRLTEGVVAAAPVVAVLLAFSLLLTVLRQSRPKASDAALSPRGQAALPPAPAAEAADEPQADADQAPDGSAPVAETQEIPLLADLASDADKAGEASHGLPDPAIAPTPAEAVLAATAPETPDTALTADAPAIPAAEPSPPPRPALQAIRYASSAASESASDYWDSDVDPALAGQVYPVLISDPDIDTSGYQPDEPPDVDDTDAPPFATAPFASVPRLNRMRVAPIPPSDSDDEG